MERSSTTSLEAALACAARDEGGDNISVARWFAAYGLLLAAAAVPLALLLADQPWTWSQWLHDGGRLFRATGPAVKLLVFGMYLSLCCTFLPLPTGWIVAAVATREAAVAAGISSNVLAVALATTALVAAVGAVGSMLANLNDYHLMTLMLRHRAIRKVRYTRLVRLSARWFNKSPFAIVTIFSIVPIPVDVIRMLAAACRYGRLPFAGANLLGRFVRYAVIAFVTYWWDLGWIAVVALLGLAIALGAARLLWMAMARAFRPAEAPQNPQVPSEGARP